MDVFVALVIALCPPDGTATIPPSPPLPVRVDTDGDGVGDATCLRDDCWPT